MANVYDIIIRPIITERSMVDVANKKYVFEVAKDAGKVEIKNAVETLSALRSPRSTRSTSAARPSASVPAAWARPAAGRRPMCSSLKIPRPSSCSRAWCKEDMRNGY